MVWQEVMDRRTDILAHFLFADVPLRVGRAHGKQPQLVCRASRRRTLEQTTEHVHIGAHGSHGMARPAIGPLALTFCFLDRSPFQIWGHS